MSIALVAAVARNGVIGRDNQLLWRLKTDLQHFRSLTIGRPVIMGRKTFESIGRPLPKRMNIVVTRNPDFVAPGTVLAADIDTALSIAASAPLQDGFNAERVMVAGGGDIYAQTIGRADSLFITEVDIEPAGDAFFPKIDPARWREVRRERHPKGPDDEAAFAFVDYVRR